MYFNTKSPVVIEPIVFNTKQIEKNDSLVEEELEVIKYNGEDTKYQISTYGEVYRTDTGAYLKPVIKRQKDRKSFYLSNNIITNCGIKFLPIHRLVAIAFIPIPKKYKKLGLTYSDLEVNHIDGNKWHNVVNNLEWSTHDDNMKHAEKNNLINHAKGENCGTSTITNKDAIKICELLQDGLFPKEISEKLNISIRVIQHIKAGDNWKDISKNYIFPKLQTKTGRTGPNTITDEIVHSICKILEERAFGKNKLSEQEIGDKFNVSRSYVNLIFNRKCRTDISKGYKF